MKTSAPTLPIGRFASAFLILNFAGSPPLLPRTNLPVPLRFRRLAATLLAMTIAIGISAQAQVYEKVFSFTYSAASNNNGSPGASLVQGGDGNFYGTTQNGGPYNAGTIFKMTLAGALTTLVEFTGNGPTNEGSGPGAALVEGSDGNFYGTTSGGGSNGNGTVFQMTPAGALTTLVEFTGNGAVDVGGNPQAGLVQGSDGNLYGTTANGGANGLGTVFKMTPAGALTTLVEFTGNGSTNAGSAPTASLIQGSDGNFYGTTATGGANGLGTVFTMTPAGALTTLVEFTGNGATNEGIGPSAALVEGGDGNFYGTTSNGGPYDAGTIFKMTPAGVLNTLADGATNEGRYPVAGLIQGSDGNFYGTTEGGGANGDGIVFQMTPAGVLTTLVEFTGNGATDAGGDPNGLVEGSDGNFYGTTSGGSAGEDGGGTVFEMTPAGALTTLVEFTENGAANDGSNPNGLFEGGDGNLYGTTEGGGAYSAGTVFQMTLAGGLTTLVEFNSDAANEGASPQGRLVQGSDGNFYGTTVFGGANQLGTVFQMTPAGALTTLIEFTGNGAANDGSNPQAGLVQGSDENFYGTTPQGGAYGGGTVFQMTPAGVLTTLVEFTGDGAANEGSYPFAGLVQGNDGNFYGTTANGGANGLGTVFQMTPAGVLTTLVEFTGNGATNEGEHPFGSLIQGSDGNFYGTTYGTNEETGTYGAGTVFQMTLAGVLTTLVAFTGNGGTNEGSFPVAGLVEGSDGNFYGTTTGGGANDLGTVFQMTPAGALTTLYDFSNDPNDVQPFAPLVPGPDGNLYGTASGGALGSGSVFRLVFPGAPNVYLLDPQVQGTTSAITSAKINPRGAVTSVSLEYGSDGVTFPNTAQISSNLTGFQTELVGTTLGNLSPGTIYYYRIVAASSAGTTLSPVVIFSTLAPPAAEVGAASALAPASAQLNGTVNAEKYEATVVFQYGTDGNTFPNLAPATPSTISGASDTAVNANVAGLQPGTIYYYRIQATNAGGTTVSGVNSFYTPIAPLVTTGAASAMTTISAQVTGTVNALGSDTTVVFQYGTNGATFPNSVAASPATVTGNAVTAVAAVLGDLEQGTTYYYQIQATNAGGVSTSSVGQFELGVLSGLNQTYPGPLPDQGSLLVTLTPSGIGSAWRFVGEQQWRQSGVPVSGLQAGELTIEFRPVSGYIQPLDEIAQVAGGATAPIAAQYYQTPELTSGGLNVTIEPEALADPSVPLAQRAQWRLLGEGIEDPANPAYLTDPSWLNSGATASGLADGIYLVEFKPVAGETTPAPESVVVQNGLTIAALAVYVPVGAQVGTVPSLVPFQTVTGDQTLPYAFVGQVRSDDGVATGFVVEDHVVATAGHVVFDDSTLTWTTGLQWLFQREAGTYEPTPQLPQGSYVLAGYAAQRILEGTPGVSSPLSQNLDAAALYFLDVAGRGASSGYLASDSPVNEFLASSALKTLVGYPVDGIPATNQGQIFATPPANVTFTRAPGTDASGNPFRIYTTANITAAGGTSGGPLCVQYQGDAYYPAAIYLGGSGQSVVRAIDGQVITLFASAETSGNGGPNHVGGGVTQENAPGSAATYSGGGMQVTLAPPGAVAAGAQWTIGNGFQASGATSSNLGPGLYQVTFAPVAGYTPPLPEQVQVLQGKIATFTASYTLLPPTLTGPASVLGAAQVALTIQPVASGSPASFSATVNGGQTLAALGLTLNSQTGAVTGTPPQGAEGNYTLVFTAANAGGTSQPLSVALSISQPGTLMVNLAGAGRGSVSPSLPTLLVPNKKYTVTARPAPGSLFDGWTGTGTSGIPSSAAKLTFTMSDLVQLTATFVPNPFPPVAGGYTGLLANASSGAPAGRLTLQLTSLGVYTGKLTLGANRYSFSGTFDPSGNFHSIVPLGNAGSLVLGGAVDFSATPPAITGTATMGATVFNIAALANFKAGAGGSSAFRGRYTLALPGDPTQAGEAAFPQGDGYATLQVTRGGAVTLTGVLGDGQAFGAGGMLASNNSWVLYATPYKSAGLVAGTEAFHPETAPDINWIDGNLSWARQALPNVARYPGGFSGSIATQGSLYIVPSAHSPLLSPTYSAILTLSVPGQSSPLAISATLDTNNQFMLGSAAPDSVSLHLAAPSGLLHGIIQIGPDQSIRCHGAFLLRQQAGYGQCVTPQATGPFTLLPPP